MGRRQPTLQMRCVVGHLHSQWYSAICMLPEPLRQGVTATPLCDLHPSQLQAPEGAQRQGASRQGAVPANHAAAHSGCVRLYSCITCTTP